MVVAQEDLEQIDKARKPRPAAPSRGRVNRDSGPLRGFNDPATQDYNPLPLRPSDSGPDQAEQPAQQETEAARSQDFRAGTVEAQRRQAQQTQAGPSQPKGSQPSSIAAAGKQPAVNAGAEAIVSKLGAQGFAIVTIITFLREHKTIAFIILFLIGAFAFFLISFLIIAIYYAVNPCEAQNLPLPPFVKVVITLTNITCAIK